MPFFGLLARESRMPKVGMKPIRRKQLIEATIASIGEHGFADTTVATISRRAGVSPGIVHHYFKDKDALLEATMRNLLEQLRVAVIVRLRAANSPRQRAEAVIDGNFAPRQFDRDAVTAWLAFWTHALHDPDLMRLRRLNVRRARSNLVDALKPLMLEREIEPAVTELIALIDGLWLYAALSEDRDIQSLGSMARDYLDRILGAAGDEPAAADRTARNGVFAWQR